MRRIPCLKLWSAVALGLALGLTTFARPARAQFPVFYGGEVLTPFGNRGSDGSYRNPAQAPRHTTARAYSQTVPRHQYARRPGMTHARPMRQYARRWR